MKVVRPNVSPGVLRRLRWIERGFDRRLGNAIEEALEKLESGEGDTFASILKLGSALDSAAQALAAVRRKPSSRKSTLAELDRALKAAEGPLADSEEKAASLVGIPLRSLKSLHHEAELEVEECLGKGLARNRPSESSRALCRLAVALGAIRHPNFGGAKT